METAKIEVSDEELKLDIDDGFEAKLGIGSEENGLGDYNILCDDDVTHLETKITISDDQQYQGTGFEAEIYEVNENNGKIQLKLKSREIQDVHCDKPSKQWSDKDVLQKQIKCSSNVTLSDVINIGIEDEHKPSLMPEEQEKRDGEFIVEFGGSFIVDVDIDKELEENKLLDSVCIVNPDSIGSLKIEDVSVEESTEQPEIKDDNTEENTEKTKQLPPAKLKGNLLLKCVLHDENEDTYVCQYCYHRSKRKKGIVMHVMMKHFRKHKTVHREAAIKSGKRSLQNIVKSIHVYECPDCSFKTQIRSTFVDHLRKKHGSDTELFSRSLMKTAHKGSKQEYRCEQCNYRGRVKYLLDSHVQTKHSQVDNVEKCTICAHTGANKPELAAHMKAAHDAAISELYQCPLCSYKTTNKYYLKKHTDMRHNENITLFRCRFCEYRTKRMDSLRRHVTVKHEESVTMHQCTKCNYRTKLKGYLNKHVKYMHAKGPEATKCRLCDFKTFNKFEMAQHVKRAHVKQNGYYHCLKCEYKTNRRDRYLQHMKRHTVTSVFYRCVFCEYGTASSDSITEHMRDQHVWF